MQIDLRQASTGDLLRLYCNLLDELRARGVLRSTNNPVADYTEHLVATALGLTRTGGSASGYDATDAVGKRYQIKGRRLTPQNPSMQLSAIRNLPTRPFDVLATVMYRADFSVDYAALVPFEVVAERSRYQEHTNSYRFMMDRKVLNDPRVINITARLAA